MLFKSLCRTSLIEIIFGCGAEAIVTGVCSNSGYKFESLNPTRLNTSFTYALRTARGDVPSLNALIFSRIFDKKLSNDSSPGIVMFVGNPEDGRVNASRDTPFAELAGTLFNPRLINQSIISPA